KGRPFDVAALTDESVHIPALAGNPVNDHPRPRNGLNSARIVDERKGVDVDLEFTTSRLTLTKASESIHFMPGARAGILILHRTALHPKGRPFRLNQRRQGRR